MQLSYKLMKIITLFSGGYKYCTVNTVQNPIRLFPYELSGDLDTQFAKKTVPINKDFTVNPTVMINKEDLTREP